MTRSLWLISLICTGCVVLPTTKTKTRYAGTEQTALTYGKVKAVTLQTAASRKDVRVRATSTRECQRQILAVTELTKSKHAKLGVDDPRGRVLGVFFAPITIPISAIITGLVVATSDDSTTRVTTPVRTEAIECTSEAAGLALELEFPSGHVQRGKTDANGVLAVAIPRDEPYSGNVVVRGDNVTAQVQYEQARPPITVARDAIEACRAQQQFAAVTLKLTVNERGLVTRMWLSAGDDKLHACVAARIAGIVFPNTLRSTTVVLPFEAPST
ncbi:MAG TPA: hypothetical protein VIV11_32335 [Kofleriaceae bacterium]